MLTSDIAALAPGQSARAAMLTPKGKVVADLLVHAEADALWLDTEPSLREKLREALGRFIVMDDVDLVDRTDQTSEIGLYGAGAAALAAPSPELRFISTPLGLHVLGEGDAAQAFGEALVSRGDVVRLTEEAAEVLRVERGVSRYGAEISEEDLPLEAGLDDAISHTKGCYIGQEPVARVTARGHVNRKIVGLSCAGLPAAGAAISAEGRPEAGHVTSAVWSPTLGRAVALGYLHRSAWSPGTKVTIAGPSENAIEATVAPLPFVEW
jgi:folate-binding protein YgfZ